MRICFGRLRRAKCDKLDIDSTKLFRTVIVTKSPVDSSASQGVCDFYLISKNKLFNDLAIKIFHAKSDSYFRFGVKF